MSTGPSQSLVDFRHSMKLAERLLVLERQYRDPAPKSEEQEVHGLRGGAAVLMVAAFERFIKSCVQERLGELRSRQPRAHFNKLPDRIKVASIFTSLQRAIDGPEFGKKNEKVHRIPDILQAASDAVQGVVNVSSISETSGNPSADTIKSLFLKCDIEDLFTTIKPRFESKWGPVAHTFINDKLTEIIDRRHVVAHTGDVSNISRQDLVEAARFLRHLGTTLDTELRIKVNKVYRASK